MEAGPERGRLADRTFQVYQRALHPEWFAVREHERLSLGPWEADVRIVEGGHVLTFGAGDVRITEVFGGPELQLPTQGLILNSPVRRERNAVLRPGGRLHYQICQEIERVDLHVFRHLCEEMILDARPGRLLHAYSTVDRFSPRPLSHIWVDRLPLGISIQAFHSFPDDLAVFRSQSLVELEPKA